MEKPLTTIEYTLTPFDPPDDDPIWDSFSKLLKNGQLDEDNLIYCNRCFESGIIEQLPENLEIVKDHHRKCHPIETLPSHLWRYFCLVEEDDDTMQCIRCLEEVGHSRKFRTTSLSVLSDHLASSHEIAIEDEVGEEAQESNSSQTTTAKTVDVIEAVAYEPFDVSMMEETSSIQFKSIRKASGVWAFYKHMTDSKGNLIDDSYFCARCLEDGQEQKYRSSTATSNLRRHLRVAHGITFEEIDEPTDSPWRPLDGKKGKFSGAWRFFCKLVKENQIVDDGFVYCGKCLEQNVRHRYSASTSTGSLKKHLLGAHQIDCNRHELDYKFDAAKAAEADVMREKKNSDVWRYFNSATNDVQHYYCLICLKEGRERKYRITTSTSSLRRHLVVAHYYETDRFSCSEEDLECGEIYIENVVPNTPRNRKKITMKPIKYCRACGDQEIGFFSDLSATVVDIEGAEDLKLSDLYVDCTGIALNQVEGLSSIICYICEAKLKSAYKFRIAAQETEKRMIEKYGSKDNSIKVEYFDQYEVLADVVPGHPPSNEIVNIYPEGSEEEEPEEEEQERPTKRQRNEPKFESNNDPEAEDTIVAIPIDQITTVHQINIKTPVKKTRKDSKPPPEDADDEEIIRTDCEKFFPDSNETLDTTCTKCKNASFPSEPLLRQHNLTVHGHETPFKSVCGKKFASKCDLDRHDEFMHAVQTCPNCGIVFANQDQLNGHTRVAHQSVQQGEAIVVQLYRCEQCAFNFSSKNTYDLHLSEHDRYFKCVYCTHITPSKRELKKHESSKHRHFCDICGQSFASRVLLDTHGRRHSGERPFRKKRDKIVFGDPANTGHKATPWPGIGLENGTTLLEIL